MSFTWALALMACTSISETPTPFGPPAPAAPPAPDWPEPTEPRYAGSHILLAWKGAVDAPDGVSRSESEAKALAERLAGQATPKTFAALAREHSDGPSAPRGGRLGTWLTGTMVPDFERAVASVEVGAVGPIVRTPFGWHVVMREAVEEVTVAHILVGYSGALQSRAGRSKDAARTRAEALLKRLEAGEPFEALAREESDDSSSERGGALGRLSRGVMVPPFEDAAFALEEGAVSGVVETPYGFHLIRRLSTAD